MKLEKYGRLGNWILTAVLFLCCLYALHDMQTAEGVGLFFTLKLGLEQRLILDVAVDVLCMAVLALLLYLPCRMFGYHSAGAYLRLFVVYLAVMPQLSLAKIIALLAPEEPLFLGGMGFGAALRSWIYSLVPFLQIWVPVLILVYGIAVISQSFCLLQRHKRILICMGVFVLLLLVFPPVENLLLYLAGYCGLLLAFDCWEALFQKLPDTKKWYFWIFVLLLLRGLYRIVVLMSQF